MEDAILHFISSASGAFTVLLIISAITWLIFPFLVLSKLNKIIVLLQPPPPAPPPPPVIPSDPSDQS